MANWWENDPVSDSSTSDNFWESDPVSEPTTASEGGSNRLPSPSVAMYSNKSAEEVEALHQSYLNHPDMVRDPLTNMPIYDGKLVPTPTRNWLGGGVVGNAITETVGLGRPFDEYVSSPVDIATGTIQTGAKNLLETGASVVDWALGTNLAEDIDNSVATLDGGGAVEDLVIEGAQMIYGGGAAMKGAEAIVPLRNAATRLGRGLQSLGRNAAFTVGATASLDADTETLFTGENAWQPIFEGVPRDANGDYSEEVLTKRMNVLLEGIAVGAVIDLGVAGGAKAVAWWQENVTSAIKGQISADAQSNRLVQSLMRQLPGVENLEGDALRQKLLEIGEMAVENKEVILNTPTGTQSVSMDTGSAIARGFEEGGDELAARNMRTTRDNSFAARFPGMQEQTNRQNMELETFTQRAYDEAGGADAVEAGRQEFTQAGNAEVGTARQNVQTAEGDLAIAQSDLQGTIDNDPLMGDRLRNIRDQSNMGQKEEALGHIESISGRIANLRGVDRAHQAAAYEAIPEGVPIDIEGLQTALADIGESLPANVRAKFGSMQGETFVVNPDLDYKELYGTVADINKALGGLYRRLETGKDSNVQFDIDELLALKKHIQSEQLTTIAQRNDGELAPIVDNIHQINEEFYTRWDGSEAMARAGYMVDDFTKGRIRPPAFDRGMRKLLEGSIKDTEFEHAGQIYQALEATGDSALATDYVLARIADNLSKGEVTPERILSSVDGFMTTLRRNDPDTLAKLQTFRDAIEAGRGDTALLQESLEQFRVAASRAEDRIFGGVLKEFYERRGGDFREIENGQAVFNRIFTDDNSKATIRDLIDFAKNEASNPEVAIQGLRAAYGRALIENSRVAVGKQDEILRVANSIFEDDPTMVRATEEFFRIMNQKNMSNGNRDAARLPRELDEEGTQIINRLITVGFGVLNRIASTIRSGLGMARNAAQPREKMMAMLGEMWANPETFKSMVDSYANKIPSDADVSLRKDMFGMFVRAGIYTGSEEDEQQFNRDFDFTMQSPTDQQTQEVFGQ